MTNAFSTKFRAIGGASVLALSTGLAAAPAAAQVAPPQPVQSVPTPTAPAAPGNAEECTTIVSVIPAFVVCAPGTDPDGFDEDFNSISLTVEEGAQVQGEIELLIGANVLVDGDIVIAGDAPAIDVDEVSTVVVNGFVSSNVTFDGLIVAGRDSSIVNNGTLFGTSSAQAGILVDRNSVVVNNGQIVGSGNSFGVLGGQSFAETGISVTNSISGQIIVDSQDISAAGILLGTGRRSIMTA